MPLPPPSDLLAEAETALVEGRPEATLELVREILERQPNHAGAMFLEAEALRDLREATEAEARYRRVLHAEPQNADAWSGLGSAMVDQGLFDEAGACFARALRCRPDHADATYGRAMVRERRGDAAGARRDYLRAWRLSSRYPLPRRLEDAEVRALLLEAAEEADPAVAAWLRAAPVVILDTPDLSTCEAYDPPASPVELIGHVPLSLLPEGAGPQPWTLAAPPVLLFRRNLERYAHDRAQVVEALRDGVVAHAGTWLGEAAFGA
ncbi:MAG: tetratricopeptide repeat protein [Alphaproteobacteria bacterium]|nr:tetratricopeptide repeat protein [Alphaproteobacteria bacterium]